MTLIENETKRRERRNTRNRRNRQNRRNRRNRRRSLYTCISDKQKPAMTSSESERQAETYGETRRIHTDRHIQQTDKYHQLVIDKKTDDYIRGELDELISRFHSNVERFVFKSPPSGPTGCYFMPNPVGFYGRLNQGDYVSTYDVDCKKGRGSTSRHVPRRDTSRCAVPRRDATYRRQRS